MFSLLVYFLSFPLFFTAHEGKTHAFLFPPHSAEKAADGEGSVETGYLNERVDPWTFISNLA